MYTLRYERMSKELGIVETHELAFSDDEFSDFLRIFARIITTPGQGARYELTADDDGTPVLTLVRSKNSRKGAF